MTLGKQVDSPYVGLAPYAASESRFFFGRDREKRLLIANLFSSPLTIAYGASGVGKTSLLRAGVVAELTGRMHRSVEMGERPYYIVILFSSWQDNPLVRLLMELKNAMVGLVPDREIVRLASADSLDSFLQLANTLLDAELFILFDQFEEYFLYHPHNGTPDRFVAEFSSAVNNVAAARFLISIRDDSLSKLDLFKPLIPNLFANYLRIPHLTPLAARQAIFGALNEYNALPEGERACPGQFDIEPELAEALIQETLIGRLLLGDTGCGDVTNNPAGIEAPYLQLVLSAIWNAEIDLSSTRLRYETFAHLGGASAIVRNHVESVLTSMSPDERDTSARLFRYLVTPSGTKIAQTVPDLASFTELPEGSVKNVLEKLADSNRRVLTQIAAGDNLGKTYRYEISHDSLGQAVLEWRRKFDADQKDSIQRAEAARKQHELDQAKALALEQELRAVEQSLAARRMRLLAIALAAVAVLTLGVAAYASSQHNAARRHAHIASLLKLEADAARSRAQAAEQLAEARRAAIESAYAQSKGDRMTAEKLAEEAERFRSVARQLIALAEQQQHQLILERARLKEYVEPTDMLASEKGQTTVPAQSQLDSLKKEIAASKPARDIKFVYIPPTRSSVPTLIHGFWISETEITLGMYRVYTKATSRMMPPVPEFIQEDDHPLVMVTWGEANEYCKWAGGRLPTEAEWERAAGASEDVFDSRHLLDAIAWNENNSGDHTHPVATKRPNRFGLFDTIGNVWEWCNDWYHWYSPSTAHPAPQVSKIDRVVRGGSWNNNSGRDSYDPTDRSDDVGFRCMRE
jgi:formylglycine-generating enzyme required for sulfatase activity